MLIFILYNYNSMINVWCSANTFSKGVHGAAPTHTERGAWWSANTHRKGCMVQQSSMLAWLVQSRTLQSDDSVKREMWSYRSGTHFSAVITSICI